MLAAPAPVLSIGPSLFSHRCAAHPALHSFPTRRSSDLLGHRVVGTARTHAEAVALFGRTHPHMVLADIQLADGSSGIEAVNEIQIGRAHSELQSRENLVCRLLLEKKKNTTHQQSRQTQP